MSKIKIIIKIIVAFFVEIKELYQIIKGLNMQKKIILFLGILLFIGFFVGILGGCTSAGKLYIDANVRSANVMLPELLQYIEKDDDLDKVDKEVRLEAVKSWWSLILEKQKQLEILEQKNGK